MLLKRADDKRPQIVELERLVATVPAGQRAQIEKELRSFRAGLKGEEEAAYLIDFDVKDSKYSAVIHDLRLEIGGRVAQIDHVLLHRTLNVFVLETKHLHAGIKITEDGEFLRWNDFKKTYEGMASPFAQNERHIAVLRDAFNRIEMPTRMGVRLAPVFVSYVLVSPNARIDRPKRLDTSRIIKADVLLETIQRRFDKESVLDTLSSMTRVVSAETLEDIGRKLIALHRPATYNFAAQLLQSKTTVRADAVLSETAPQEQRDVSRRSVILVNGRPKCRGCGSESLSIQYGKFGYYFKCRSCNDNTPIKITCDREGHKERLRKDGRHFYRECIECKTSTLFYTNSE